MAPAPPGGGGATAVVRAPGEITGGALVAREGSGRLGTGRVSPGAAAVTTCAAAEGTALVFVAAAVPTTMFVNAAAAVGLTALVEIPATLETVLVGKVRFVLVPAAALLMAWRKARRISVI